MRLWESQVVFWIGIVVAVPLVLLALLAWTVVGMLCSAPYWVLVLTTCALVLPAAFVEPALNGKDGYGFGSRLLGEAVDACVLVGVP